VALQFYLKIMSLAERTTGRRKYDGNGKRRK
jgi:hypothetical protein